MCPLRHNLLGQTWSPVVLRVLHGVDTHANGYRLLCEKRTYVIFFASRVPSPPLFLFTVSSWRSAEASHLFPIEAARGTGPEWPCERFIFCVWVRPVFLEPCRSVWVTLARPTTQNRSLLFLGYSPGCLQAFHWINIKKVKTLQTC